VTLIRINDRWPLELGEPRASWIAWPYWEKERLAAMYSVIRPGDFVVDVGAEEGDLPTLWATWGADVAMIEPNPKVWPNIRTVWEANVPGEPEACFVGFAGETDNITRPHWPLSPETGWPDCATGETILDHGFLHIDERPDCPTITLNTFTARIERRPDVVTVDIEGAEYRMILGAGRLLEEDRPIFFISVHPEFMRDRYGDTPDDLLTHMRLHRYEETFLAFDHEHHYMFKPRP
jgi:FkbM family methyltransferase